MLFRSRRFQPVNIEEPSEEEAIRILEGIKTKYEEHHNVIISQDAIEAAVRLSNRYINDRNLPDKAIDLIDEASSAARLNFTNSSDKQLQVQQDMQQIDSQIENAIRMEAYETASQLKQEQDLLMKKLERMNKRSKKVTGISTIKEADIEEVVAMWTKIPVQKLAEKERDRKSVV